MEIKTCCCLFLELYTCTFFFFLTHYLNHVPDLPQKIVDRQYQFFELEGNTRLALDSLNSEPASFLFILPQALNHAFLRPWINEIKSPLHLATFIDNLLFAIVLISVIYILIKNRGAYLNHFLVLTCLFTACFGYLIIGYIVPFPGAIIRYRSLFEFLFYVGFAIIIGSNHRRAQLH